MVTIVDMESFVGQYSDQADALDESEGENASDALEEFVSAFSREIEARSFPKRKQVFLSASLEFIEELYFFRYITRDRERMLF
jgi:hypothetical protein